jgi:heat shock protein HslJ
MKFVHHYCVCLTIALTGCSATASGTQPIAQSLKLENQAWQLESVNGINTKTSRASLEFTAGRLSGSDACNRIMGEYQSDANGRLSIKTPLATTRMACVERVDEISRAVHKALKETSVYAFVSEKLELRNAQGTVLAVYGAALNTSK